MREIYFYFTKVPDEPAVYVMRDRNNGVAYVGISGNLKNKLKQHFDRRDISVTTGVSATVLNPDKVSRVEWWTHDNFSNDIFREATELIAFYIFDPALRSRGTVNEEAKKLMKDSDFQREIRYLFKDEPAGVFIPKNLDNLTDLVMKMKDKMDYNI
ncbi:GIY-YIG nuclease family protein [Bacteroidota bacterium]